MYNKGIKTYYFIWWQDGELCPFHFSKRSTGIWMWHRHLASYFCGKHAILIFLKCEAMSYSEAPKIVQARHKCKQINMTCVLDFFKLFFFLRNLAEVPFFSSGFLLASPIWALSSAGWTWPLYTSQVYGVSKCCARTFASWHQARTCWRWSEYLGVSMQEIRWWKGSVLTCSPFWDCLCHPVLSLNNLVCMARVPTN